MGAVGNHLAFDFDGPTLEASLSRAVECFADAVADVHPSLATQRRPIHVAGATPAALLLAVLEECLRRGREGEVVLGLEVASLADGVLDGVVLTVPGTDPHVAATLPHVVSWHEVSLEPAGGVVGAGEGRWRGRVSY